MRLTEQRAEVTAEIMVKEEKLRQACREIRSLKGIVQRLKAELFDLGELRCKLEEMEHEVDNPDEI